MSGKEIEFKYNAKSIFITDFIKFCQKKFKTDYVAAIGWDHFYGNKKDKNAFFRHRVGNDINQLTYKKKLNNTDNFIRVEHNIDLDLKKFHRFTIAGLCESLGFKYNMSLKKSAFIFANDEYIAVYYICFNARGEEIGRFVELELSEEIDWGSDKKALKELRKIEKEFMLIGISPKKRIKASLWEMYKNK